jgi:hypothetical protein
LFDWAEAESIHRRALESGANESNILAQQKHLAVLAEQSRGVFVSDLVGQICGALISLACIAGVAYLALNDHEVAGAALAGIPTAAVIQAFFAKRQLKDTPQK